jgi:UDP-galactopyranose mutase
MLDDVDLLVCGAGPVGCVIAERAAAVLGWKVLLIDRRRHLAGNCHDGAHASGVLIHHYGPHYFRTNDEALLRYLSRFTEWVDARYEVRSQVGGRLYPFPINLTTLEMFFGQKLDADSARRLLEEKRIPCQLPRNSEEFVLDRVGRELYEAFYLNYTRKQWEMHPRELEPGVCGRIPVRFDRDGRYVNHRFQVMPARGFTALFARMVRHRKIRVLLDCDFREVRNLFRPRRATVYTGPIDEYFDHCLGRLPYRSLRFEHVAHRPGVDRTSPPLAGALALRSLADASGLCQTAARAQLLERTPGQAAFVQPCVQINYPNDFTYTRSVEIKHVTGQKHPMTVVTYETPAATGEPYYPVPAPANTALYRRYQELAEQETARRQVYFCGRLAQYHYFNTDEVIGEALKCFEQIRRRQPAAARRSAWSPTTSTTSCATGASALTTG